MSLEIESTAGCTPRACTPRACGVTDAWNVVGDRWTLLVLHELFLGVHRFSDIQANTGAPRSSVSMRLRKLERAGLVVRQRYCERPPRDEYVLTPAGQAMGPALRELQAWGETYAR
ncbi:winged helix-turn-helix transcriptional regulator [Streptomyces sp. NBC_01518]|uniref:winged helix-turn-helix transcriptional regulator n=1 Tax=Streptomyces sp. NBC_01518 TaxID=2903891 RepID=UPI00386F4184